MSNISPKKSEKNHSYFYQIIDTSNRETSYIDQTGRFPHQLSRGDNHILVCYDYDSNVILTEPIKNREAELITNAWYKCHKILTKNGHVTTKYILDN